VAVLATWDVCAFPFGCQCSKACTSPLPLALSLPSNASILRSPNHVLCSRRPHIFLALSPQQGCPRLYMVIWESQVQFAMPAIQLPMLDMCQRTVDHLALDQHGWWRVTSDPHSSLSGQKFIKSHWFAPKYNSPLLSCLPPIRLVCSLLVPCSYHEGLHSDMPCGVGCLR
jgi:hypothetical protein